MKQNNSYIARLEDKIILNDKFTLFEFELDDPHQFKFAAGQSVSVQVSGEGERRAYSVASTPEYDYKLELILDITPQGKGTTYFNNLQFGDKINFLGPQGNFVFQNKTEEKAINFIATGSGIAPFRSLIWDLLKIQQEKRPITLYWGMRHEDDLFLLDEWQHSPHGKRGCFLFVWW